MRKLMRSMARANMTERKIERINDHHRDKNGNVIKSVFSRTWRKYAKIQAMKVINNPQQHANDFSNMGRKMGILKRIALLAKRG